MEKQLTFADREEFRKWLQANHGTSPAIWLIFGKANRLMTVKPDEALEEALCFGWIDGQLKSIDDEKYHKKFSRRRTGSKWSARNREIVGRLIETGKMTESGMSAIEQAKKSGNWDMPERVTATDEQVEILVEALQGVKPALTNFLKMSPSIRRTYTMYYLDAKREETRIRRLQGIIQRLNENKGPM